MPAIPSPSAPAAAADAAHFADRLIDRARSLGHCFCLGLDPHLALIPPVFRRGDMAPSAPATIAAVEDFLLAALDEAAGKVVAVKPQSAMFERLGSPGIALLERIVAVARDKGPMVILDAKRGDIAATAEAYADAYLAPDSPNPADALTVNPYLGLDTLAPYLDRCARHGKGVFVLVKTSNPGSADFQDVEAGGTTLHARVAEALRPLSEPLRGPGTGWSSLGVVVGATYPEQAVRIRRRLPHALFLIPGYGHQQGDIDRIRGALVPGPRRLEGGVISSARGTLFPEAAAAGPLAAWRSAFAGKLAADIAGVAECVTP